MHYSSQLMEIMTCYGLKELINGTPSYFLGKLKGTFLTQDKIFIKLII